MKILLLAFSVQDDAFPLGLYYLKAFGQKHHPDVEIKIKEFSFGTRAKYDTNKNLELQALSYIALEKPDVIAFSCFIWSSEMILDFAKSIKSQNPKIKTVLGGVEANDDLLQDGVDFIIHGEGELAFKELLEHFNGSRRKSEVHNIIYLEDGKMIYGPHGFLEDLDEIPFPYQYAPQKKYAAVRLEASRGCIFDCSFCHYAVIPLRHFSLGYLEKAIDHLFGNFDFRVLTILDGTFNADKKRMFSILDLIGRKTRESQKKIKVHCEMRPELLDKETVDSLEKYPYAIEIELGLQSIDDAVLAGVKRPTALSRVAQALSFLDDSHLSYKIDLMYGLPQDTFFKFLLSSRFVLRNAKRQNKIVAHHYMVLNNTFPSQKDEQRYNGDSSSMVIKTNTQNAFELYKTKLFIDMLNDELAIK